MAKSLQDQLLSAGLIDKKKAKTIDKAKKHAKRTQSGEVNQASQLAQQAIKEKAERDKALNRRKNEQAEQKAILAQIKQLIQSNQINSNDGEFAYQFTDCNAIKKIHVSPTIQANLANGHVAIVRHDDGYALIPKKVAEKIAERDTSFIVLFNNGSKEKIDEDDPYADYQIPDDLMW